MAELIPGVTVIWGRTPVPESLDVRVLHVKKRNPTELRMSIVRALSRIEEGRPEVDLFLVVPINHGLADMHFILSPQQAADLLRMIESALQTAVLSLKEGPADA